MDPEEYTLPERFQDAGYATALIGKWHQGAHAESHPNQNGFDYFYGFLGGYTTPGTGSRRLGFVSKWGAGRPYDWQRNGENVFESEYATILLGKDASRFVRERDRSKPYFLMLSFNAPHFPQVAPEEIVDQYVNDSSCCEVRCRYMAQVDLMDREIGRLVATLESEGIRDSTLIVFFSDNGGSSDFGGSNLPLRGEKGSVYEGAIRVVALANWPGVLASGQVSNQRMQVGDLFPTLEAAADLPIKAPPGESSNMWPAIVGNHEIRREPFLFMVDGPGRRGALQSRAVLADSWKLVVIEDDEKDDGTGSVALFDITKDPNEQVDLSAERPRVVRRLRRVLESLEKKQRGRESGISVGGSRGRSARSISRL